MVAPLVYKRAIGAALVPIHAVATLRAFLYEHAHGNTPNQRDDAERQFP